jgi:serine/threonine-protein kinase
MLSALDAFSAAWLEQPAPSLEAFLPPDDHPSRCPLLVALVRIDMERRIKAGWSACTEDYLQRFPELREHEEPLLKLALLEHHLRQEHGLGGSDALLIRFPKLAGYLSSQTFDTVPPLPDGPPVARPMKGLDLREYVLLEEMGQGGMGEVYRSRDPGLGRDLALKVLRPQWQNNPAVEARFEQEARITGSLQHPGIVPVYNLGCLPDGRMYFTMKVVRGRTFAEILHSSQERSARQRAEDVGIFEKVCQTIAYAHSKRVIHRDLKPANIMVGAFGEVQVMDWGLAKVLASPERSQNGPSTSAIVHVSFPDEERGEAQPNAVTLPLVPQWELGPGNEGKTQAGDVLGTCSYMSPEQARGALDQLDERCDVFGLGAVLCEVLTGQPPYTGSTSAVVHDRAMQAELGPALARLEHCGADAELVELARHCLAIEPASRPRDAGAVASAVSAYLAGVQQRLREAERKNAAAEARAVEAAARVKVERRARRLLLGLATAMLVVILGGAVGVWTWQHQRARRAQAEEQASGAVLRARGMLEEGWQAHDLAMLKEARAEAERALDIAQRGETHDALQEEAASLEREAESRLARWEKNQALLTALLDVAVSSEKRHSRPTKTGQTITEAQKSADEQYADAFRNWGLDVDRVAQSEVIARLSDEPTPVIQEVIASLDAWMSERLRQRSEEAKARRLFRLAQQLDKDAQRRQLRELLGERNLTRPESVAGLLSPTPSWPALWQLVRGDGWRRLQSLRGGIDPATAPVLTVVLLAQANSTMGDHAEAERVLRLALAARPDEVVLLDALGKLLGRQGRARYGEAIECFRAIRARDRRLGLALATTLAMTDRLAEAEAVFRELVHHQPRNSFIRYNLGLVLMKQNEDANAVAALQEAIRLAPDLHMAYSMLGVVLARQKKPVEAEAACEQAIRMRPDSPGCFLNLGIVLKGHKKLAEAAAAFQYVVKLDPSSLAGHYNLGIVLGLQNRDAEAVAAFRAAIRLDRDCALAHGDLAVSLWKLNRPREAEAACREAIRLGPDDYNAHHNLGVFLAAQNKQRQAVAAYRESLRLKPNQARTHYTLGYSLLKQNKYAEAEASLKEAVRLKPDFADAQMSLGLALAAQKKLGESEAAFKEARRYKPGDPNIHRGLGAVLTKQNKLAEAEAAIKEAIRIAPDIPEVFISLGDVQRRQGKFAESLAAFRQGHQLGWGKEGWPFDSAQMVRQARRRVELDRKLPALLKGAVRPKDVAEQIELAELCILKRWYAGSARFWTDAFAGMPALAEDIKASRRYDAACVAVLAGCGRGEDPVKPDDRERAGLRKQALDWLRAELDGWSKRLDRDTPSDRAATTDRLRRWKMDADLAGVRDRETVEKLPDDELRTWRQFWADVDDLIQRAEGK